MQRTFRYYGIMWLRHDFAAGLSVFLVALPLCLGIALASGAPLYAGLLSGIIGGILVSSISGSALSVSGPAAGLSTLVAGAILSLGDYKVFLLSVFIAGLLQLIIGMLKMGGIANFFPSAVIKGMLAAIGIILISKQVPLALGYEQPDFWTSGFLDLIFSTNVLGNLSTFGQRIHFSSVLVFILSLGTMLLLQGRLPKMAGKLPAPLFAVMMGIGANWLLGYASPQWTLRPSQLVHIPDNLFAQIVFPDFSKLFSNPQIWKAGVAIGILASLETLLCVEAIDKLDRHNRITPVNREMVAQGVGNIACGLLGAIPLTAVVVRGAANVDAGGRTKLSAITHGMLLLLAVLLIPFALNQIPYASLAAILLVTGFNLTKPRLYINMWQLKWKQFLPFIFTILIILASDLLIGVTIGLLISIYFIIQNNFRAEYKITKTTRLGIETDLIKLNSNVTFLNKAKLKKALDEIPAYSVLTIDGSECNFIDYDILEIISEFESKARDRHIELHLLGIERVNVTAVH
ncbi:MAG TPA: SulP family inorganic anion transporter [Lacibacter sp.]|nr:SulP family inorganic anion transporter [Lacibacter sp.]